ncbi:MAG TPA: DEAD/DEAH box helicase [Rhizomicrobium sp.]|nr:DEAD/DEAH box helicase [Rhizomicrobium sp.]
MPAAPAAGSTFDDLGLSAEVLKAVKETGYTIPTPIQAQGIPHVLQRRDIIGIAQTGTGKTASFTLPMIELLARGRAKARMPRSLILEPTRELAAQVAESFEKYGKFNKLSMALLIGGTSFDDQEKKLDRGVDVLIATPGRLLDHFERGKLMLSQVNILVIDEADRMLDMGFIPDVERICKLIPFTRQTLFYSATMPPEITRLTEQFLHNPVRVEVARPATAAANIVQEIVHVPANDWAKREALRRLIRESEPTLNNAIVFCNRKRDVDVVAKSLVKHGFDAAPLHGDLDQSLRTKTLDKFRAGDLKILVASDVAARGLDIPATSHVFNFDVPFHPDDYVHRIGRTGRAGRSGHTYMLVTPRDEKQLSAIEHLTKNKIGVKEIGEIEVREDRSPRRDDKRRDGGRGGKRNADRRDRFRPDKFHDHVASMEPSAPTEASAAPAEQPMTADAPAPKPQREPRAPREQKPRGEHREKRPEHRAEKPRQEGPRHEGPRHEGPRAEKPHRAHQDRKNDATPVKPERHELPAFLFKPINLPKKADA